MIEIEQKRQRGRGGREKNSRVNAGGKLLFTCRLATRKQSLNSPRRQLVILGHALSPKLDTSKPQIGLNVDALTARVPRTALNQL